MSFNHKKASSYFTDETAEKLKSEINAAHGNEVLFFGWMGEDREVERVEVIARGNDASVAIPLEKSFLPDVIIHNHPDGCLTPSSQDVRISSLIANRSVGFFIINNKASEVYVVIEPVERREAVPLKAGELTALVSRDGPFKKLFPSFEEREGQMQMIEYVCDAFNNSVLTLIEAGTGIGKSLAYLIPSVRWALENNEKVVISTNTINLQEQLLYKDIPDLKRALGGDFTYILMKGRGNYICLNRLYEAKQDLFSLIDDEELEQFTAIEAWLETAEEASLSELPFIPKPSLWEKINSQAGICLGGSCAYFSSCSINRVRRHAAEAHLIVTNHHYLLADAQVSHSGASLLPPYRRVIFDEAHNLEDSATSFFTRSITLSGTLNIFHRMYTGPRKNKGYLAYLFKKEIFSHDEKIKRIMNDVTNARAAVAELFKKVDNFIAAVNTDYSPGPAVVIELNDEIKNHPLWEKDIVKALDVFYKECSMLINGLLEVNERLAEEGDDRTSKQIDGFITRLVEIVEAIDVFLGENDEEYVRWVEKKREAGIVVSLIEVGSVLYDLLFRRMKSIVLTSATLTVGDSFDFIKSRLSITNTCTCAQIGSSFDYDKQMKVFIPDDITEPGHPGYIKNLAESIIGVVKKTEGKAFILFTSYQTMGGVYDMVKDDLADSGFVIYKQGSESRRSLMENFKADLHSVLFGTVSFWEGVDAPGRTLECVVITKLPFKVPSEPIVRARIEKIRERGGNAFLDYYVPLAVIKMKQGIGRLIRNKKDRGIIVILDRRILVKNYGSLFLHSIPTKNIFKGHFTDVLEAAGTFLAITP